ncbi:MAG: sigma-70 family RNA polymerase sigma factor [Leptolyngbyaceae cyanobacterium]
MPDPENQLQQLVLQAQQCPAQSLQRRLALTKLIHILQQPGFLTRPKTGSFPGMYEAIYDEAVQRLFVHICHRVETYDPEKGKVLQWVNFLLSRRFFIEASRDILPTLPKGVDHKQVTRLSIDDLDRQNPLELNPGLKPSIGEELRGYIEEDAEELLQNMYVKNHPAITFQWLLLQRLDGYSWQDLAHKTEIQISTLSSFYQRSLKKVASKFREYLT